MYIKDRSSYVPEFESKQYISSVWKSSKDYSSRMFTYGAADRMKSEESQKLTNQSAVILRRALTSLCLVLIYTSYKIFCVASKYILAKNFTRGIVAYERGTSLFKTIVEIIR